jgi:hypothetical protein
MSNDEESGEAHCRICLGTEGQLIAPCHCQGTMKYTHNECMVTWMFSKRHTTFQESMSHARFLPKWITSLFAPSHRPITGNMKCDICRHNMTFEVQDRLNSKRKLLLLLSPLIAFFILLFCVVGSGVGGSATALYITRSEFIKDGLLTLLFRDDMLREAPRQTKCYPYSSKMYYTMTDTHLIYFEEVSLPKLQCIERNRTMCQTIPCDPHDAFSDYVKTYLMGQWRTAFTNHGLFWIYRLNPLAHFNITTLFDDLFFIGAFLYVVTIYPVEPVHQQPWYMYTVCIAKFFNVFFVFVLSLSAQCQKEFDSFGSSFFWSILRHVRLSTIKAGFREYFLFLYGLFHVANFIFFTLRFFYKTLRRVVIALLKDSFFEMSVGLVQESGSIFIDKIQFLNID